MKRALGLFGLLLVAAGLTASGADAAQPAPVKTRPEHVAQAPGPALTRHSTLHLTDQLPVKRMPGAASTAAAPPFLTRPYFDPHTLVSIFDHCNPDYSIDGKICENDGTVAYASNGHDPSFSAGYAVTPGGSDYLYYDGHNGLDLGLDYENLIAAAPGTVQLAGSDPYNPGFGQTVTIDHGNGFTTRYAHMSYIAVSPGQYVQRGQYIGVSGNTGYSTGPHLHFGVYVTSTWTAIDPWGWFGSTPDPWPSDQGDLWLTGNPQNPVPWAPGTPVAVAGDSAATLTWTPPTFDGGEAISGYTITASPGGKTWTAAGTATSATVTGLSNYTAYTFTVTATDGAGFTGPASAASNAVTPVPSWPGRLHSLAPARLLDTRTGLGGSTLGPASSLTLSPLAQDGIPKSGVAAVLINVTAVNVSAPTYLSVVPTGTDPTQVSAVNAAPGQMVSNLVEATLGSDGKFLVYNSAGTLDVLADVLGWFGNASDSGPDGHFHAVAPARLLDTRTGTQGITRLGPNQAVNLSVLGQGGLPAAGVEAIAVNLTAVDPTDNSYLTAWAAGAPRPGTSNLLFQPGPPRAVRAVVPVGAGGQISIYNSAGSADVLVDVTGWFSDSTATTTTTGLYSGVAPVRVLDTRTGASPAPLAGGHWVAVKVAGAGMVPATGVQAVILNVTVTDVTALSYVAVDATGTDTATSDLNFAAGATIANLVVVPVGSDGTIHVYNSQGQADVIVDVEGWFN